LSCYVQFTAGLKPAHTKNWTNRDMRFKTRLSLVVGCAGLLALMTPALSKPAPHSIAHKQPANQKIKTAGRAPAALANVRAARAARAVREERAARLVSMPISETPKRPLFGWPALVSEARKYLGTNPTARKKLWCATFMNLVLAKVGYVGTHSDAAKSFAQYGHRVSDPEVGAIAVLSRGKNGGHVGVVSGIDKNGNPIIISGNHGQRVGEAVYPRSRVIAYVMPSDRGPDNTQIAERGQPNRSAPPERSIESPVAELLAAIEAEQNRVTRPSVAPTQTPEPRRIAQPAPPPEPRRVVQQTPELPPQQSQRAGADNAAIAELLGLKARAQVAPLQRPAPQRERQVQRSQPGRVAHSDIGLAGAFSFR
jgi:uncharacterized protein (TIGR02594 family)